MFPKGIRVYTQVWELNEPSHVVDRYIFLFQNCERTCQHNRTGCGKILGTTLKMCSVSKDIRLGIILMAFFKCSDTIKYQETTFFPAFALYIQG